VDNPTLAAPGPYQAGVATLDIVEPQPVHRRLPLRVWYPARAGGAAITYRASMAGEDAKPVAFTIPGTATKDAVPVPGRFPLVLLAHGYGNNAEVMAWLGENLATKGYVVAAPTFGDPTTFDAAGAIQALAHRPLDIAFLAAEASTRARAGQAPFAHADPDRLALIGYSMGSYGVLTAAGASLAPALAPATGSALAPYVAGGAKSADLTLPHLKAVVAISPLLRLGSLNIWTAGGLAAIHAPTFIVGGSQDHLVGYDPGIRTIYASETNAPRYLLTFREAGHSIGLCDTPPEMQHNLWNKSWFEDPVWRKSRIIGIETHFITAFLDRYVKGDTTKAAYIDGLVPNSDDGTWPGAPVPFDAVSPGPPAATLWKGFQRAHVAGMMLEFRGQGK
jgi:predicted dienelactone hydrolase